MHCKQQVIVEGVSSKPYSVDSGVSQGVVLGSLLIFVPHKRSSSELDCLQMIVCCTDEYIPHLINYYSNKTLQP